MKALILTAPLPKSLVHVQELYEILGPLGTLYYVQALKEVVLEQNPNKNLLKAIEKSIESLRKTLDTFKN